MQPPNNQPPIWCTADHLQVSLDRVFLAVLLAAIRQRQGVLLLR